LELTRTVVVEVDGLAGLDDLEEAAVAFARSAPGRLVGDTIEGLTETLLEMVVGHRRFPAAGDDQPEAPWSCTRTGCGSRRGFRRRGFRSADRQLQAACGGVRFRAAQVECLACGRRFAPVLELLGLRPHQRRTDRLAALAAGLATEVAYAKAARFLSELTGIAVSARTIRNDVVAVAPHRLGPEVTEVPILLLDSTGERAGTMLRGTQLHLALGLMARHHHDGRVVCSVRLLGATLDEDWDVMGRLLAAVRPGLILVDGEAPLSDMVADMFPNVPVQRCLWHLVRGMTYTAWREGASKSHRSELRARLTALLTDAHRHQDLHQAQHAYHRLVVEMEARGVIRAARYLEAARTEVFTFISHPQAGRLLFGDNGRPELATGVLERVMRELNRRTDLGVRWSIHGCRALLMLKLARRYRHPQWPWNPTATNQPNVRFRLVT
jgi:hypothetical protein